MFGGALRWRSGLRCNGGAAARRHGGGAGVAVCGGRVHFVRLARDLDQPHFAHVAELGRVRERNERVGLRVHYHRMLAVECWQRRVPPADSVCVLRVWRAVWLALVLHAGGRVCWLAGAHRKSSAMVVVVVCGDASATGAVWCAAMPVPLALCDVYGIGTMAN